MNPDTARLSSPGELLVAKGVEGRRGGGVKTVVVMSIAAARAVLRGEDGGEIVVLRVGDVKMKSTNAGPAGVRSELMMKSLEVVDMQVITRPDNIKNRSLWIHSEPMVKSLEADMNSRGIHTAYPRFHHKILHPRLDPRACIHSRLLPDMHRRKRRSKVRPSTFCKGMRMMRRMGHA